MRTQLLFWGVLAWAATMGCGLCQSTVSFSKSASSITDQARKQADGSNKTTSSSIRPHYYDQRERVTAALTFEWEFECIHKFSRSYLEGQIDEVDDSEQLLHQGVFWVARLPQITHIQRSQEIPYLTNGKARKADEQFKADFYYLGETGEIMLYVSREKNNAVRAVSIVSAGTNGFGLRPPFPGLSLGELVFLSGVSPLRLMGVELADWKLRGVNEHEWVFELQPDKQMKARMPWLRGVDQVVVYLNRQKEDAPAKVEITQGNTTETWQTLAYKQVQGVWMPEQVLFEYKSPSFEIQSLYHLKGFSRTGKVVLDIPQGTPVQDWRWRKRALWTEGPGAFALSLSRPNEDIENIRSLKWSPELESSLWQDLR